MPAIVKRLGGIGGAKAVLTVILKSGGCGGGRCTTAPSSGGPPGEGGSVVPQALAPPSGGCTWDAPTEWRVSGAEAPPGGTDL